MQNKAFTLAEVLLTLGIIGVVAALTIPMLINRYQKNIWTKQYQKTYSIITQALRKIEDEEYGLAGRRFLGIPLNQNCPQNYNNCSISSARFDCEFLRKYLQGTCTIKTKKYIVYHLTQKKSHNETINSTFQFSSGAEIISSNTYTVKSIYHRTYNGQRLTLLGPFYIDVNGSEQKPNTMGRDIFSFYINEDDATLVPGGGPQTWYPWKTTTDYRGTCDTKNPDTHYGVGCAQRIIDEGWKMNY